MKMIDGGLQFLALFSEKCLEPKQCLLKKQSDLVVDEDESVLDQAIVRAELASKSERDHAEDKSDAYDKGCNNLYLNILIKLS